MAWNSAAASAETGTSLIATKGSIGKAAELGSGVTEGSAGDGTALTDGSPGVAGALD
jgi:hypothetical protein